MATLRTTFKALERMGFESVTDYCRALMKEPDPYGVSPETKVEVYRGDMLCLIVRSVAEGAELEPDGDRFRKYRPDKNLKGEQKRAKGVYVDLNTPSATMVALGG